MRMVSPSLLCALLACGLAVATVEVNASPNAVSKITFAGPKAGWGFLRMKSPFYSPSGKNLGTLAGGTLFKYTDVKASSKNSVMVSSIKRGGVWEGPFLLDCTAVAVYEGDPEAVDPQTVESLTRYFTASGAIAEREDELAKQARTANPHFESAQAAQKAYQDSIAKAAGLEAQMNTLTGSRKTKALDALHALKYEQTRLKIQADRTAAAFKAWKEAHPLNPAALEADPRLQTLRRELEIAKAKVAAELLPK